MAEVAPVSNTRAAGVSKLLENIYRAVDIAVSTELKLTFGHMGIDVWGVIEASKTKPFGCGQSYSSAIFKVRPSHIVLGPIVLGGTGQTGVWGRRRRGKKTALDVFHTP
jgi:hypothetical protein